MISESSCDELFLQIQEYGKIICTNNEVRRKLQSTVTQFIDIHEKFLKNVKAEKLDETNQLKFMNTNLDLESLKSKFMSEKIQLALCGENSSGKTSFLHMLLRIPDILPLGDGPVTGRIVRFTYAEPGHACIYLYRTIKERFAGSSDNLLESAPLYSFFTDDQPVESELPGLNDDTRWDEIADIVAKYTARPIGLDANSDEFSVWARNFVEIHLPLPILKLNIDLYDTPGFLCHDSPVLKEILAELVTLVRPTIVFLYNNSCASNETINAYLAMKDALKEIDSLTIFYLNNKVDIDHMPSVNEDTTIDEFGSILNEERSKRYQLLREAPCLGKDNLGGLPNTIDECNYFDVCSVLSNDDPLGLYMNNNALRRLIQFVANSDLLLAMRFTKIILPTIEAFFSLATMTSHHTIDAIQALKMDAFDWYHTFFDQHERYFDSFLTAIFNLIKSVVEEKRNYLISEAAKLENKQRMKSFIENYVTHEAVRGASSEIFEQLSKNVSEFINSNLHLMVNVSSNELLIEALQTEGSNIVIQKTGDSNGLGIFENFVLNHALSSTMFVIKVLLSEDDSKEANLLNLLLEMRMASRRKETESRSKDPVSRDSKSEAQACLFELKDQLNEQKSLLHDIVKIFNQHHKEIFEEKVQKSYEQIETLIPLRNKVDSVVVKHSLAYIRMHVQLHACVDLANFNGLEPELTIREVQKTAYNVARATWGKESLFLKFFTNGRMEQTDAAYFEASYHLKVKKLQIPFIIDSKYLYEKRSSDNSTDLWIFFPIYERTLKSVTENQAEGVTFEQMIGLMCRVAIALECLHRNEIVHGNVTASNIVFDEENDAHLIDWGDWIIDSVTDITKRHSPESNEYGVYKDIRALGKLGRDLIKYFKDVNETKINKFETLLQRCESATPRKPFVANEIHLNILMALLDRRAEFEKSLEAIGQLKRSLTSIGREFIETRDHFIKNLPQSVLNLNERQTFIETLEQIKNDDINEQETSLNLIVVGANSSGKSSFIQHFLDIGDILPTGAGPVTSRITKLTYAPSSEARAIVHSSFRAYLDSETPTIELSLSQYFTDTVPAWDQLRDSLNQHLNRAVNTDTQIETWGKSFVEIKLPSSVLKMNVDVYDTPGFLSREREKDLMDNLYALVKQIRPTLLFLYENPSVEEMDILSFIAMKKAVGNMDRLPVFFLSTKADVSLIIKNNRKHPSSVTIDSFKDLLEKTRKQRYDLLRKQPILANELLGGLPDYVDECTCFDICSVPKARTPWRSMTDHMNKQTFHRLISFTIEAQACFAHEFIDRILCSLETYFDWALEGGNHDERYLKKLHEEALCWGRQYFELFETRIPETTRDLKKEIIRLLEEKKKIITQRAARLDRENDENNDQIKSLLAGKSNRVRDFIDVVVQEEVVKEAINEIIKETRSSMQETIEIDLQNQMKRKNFLLRFAQSEILPNVSPDTLTKKRFTTRVSETFLSCVSYITKLGRGILRLPWKKYYNNDEKISDLEKKVAYDIFDTLDFYSALSNEQRRIQYASDYLDKVIDKIKKNTTDLDKNFNKLLQNQRERFVTLIDTAYRINIEHLPLHQRIDRVNMEYYSRFARVQCRILAARHLYEFKNIPPTIMLQESIGKGGFFDVHAVHWGTETDLVVKKPIKSSQNHQNMAYLDGHYQYMISLLSLTKVVPVKYFYENKSDNGGEELWIILPRYRCSLRDYLVSNIHRISFDEFLKFSIDIAETLAQLHENEIVHRDIKASNILLDENNQCYLSDFGTVKLRIFNQTIVGTLPLPPEMYPSTENDHTPNFSYDGMAADIYSFGLLLYEMYPKMEYARVRPTSCEEIKESLKYIEIDKKIDFCRIVEVIFLCVDSEPKSRPKATDVLNRLQKMQNGQISEPIENEKKCIICFENDRRLRFQPCGHKITCDTCFNNAKEQNKTSNCFYCRSVILDTRVDPDNQSTYHCQT